MHSTAFCAEKQDPAKPGIEVLSGQIVVLSNINSAGEKVEVLRKEREVQLNPKSLLYHKTQYYNLIKNVVPLSITAGFNTISTIQLPISWGPNERQILPFCGIIL